MQGRNMTTMCEKAQSTRPGSRSARARLPVWHTAAKSVLANKPGGSLGANGVAWLLAVQQNPLALLERVGMSKLPSESRGQQGSVSSLAAQTQPAVLCGNTQCWMAVHWDMCALFLTCMCAHGGSSLIYPCGD